MDFTDEMKEEQIKKHGQSVLMDTRSISQSVFYNWFFPSNSTIAEQSEDLNILQVIYSLPITFWVYIAIIVICIVIYWLITVIETDPATNRYDVKKKLKFQQKEEEKEQKEKQDKQKEKDNEAMGPLGRKLQQEEFHQQSVELEQVLISKISKSKSERKEKLDKLNVKKNKDESFESIKIKKKSGVEKSSETELEITSVGKILEKIKKYCSDHGQKAEVKRLLDLLQDLKRQMTQNPESEMIKVFTEHKGIKIVLHAVGCTLNNSSVVSLSNQILNDVLLTKVI